MHTLKSTIFLTLFLALCALTQLDCAKNNNATAGDTNGQTLGDGQNTTTGSDADGVTGGSEDLPVIGEKDLAESPDTSSSDPDTKGGEDTTQVDDTEGSDGNLGSPDTGVNPECEVGTIVGAVCAPNGSTLLNGAEVRVETTDCKGTPVTLKAISGSNGLYELSGVPIGSQTVVVNMGSFEREIEVTVETNKTVDITSFGTKGCFQTSNPKTKLAVITGDHDHIETVLGSLGLEYDTYDGVNSEAGKELLKDEAKLLSYDVVFINCNVDSNTKVWPITPIGVSNAERDKMVANLVKFTAKGGSLYVSDWMWIIIDDTWPGRINWINAAWPASGYEGTIQATVTDSLFQTFLGKDKVSITYNESSWVVMTGVGANVSVHLRGDVKSGDGDVKNAPLLVSFKTEGGGTVIFTTFHHDKIGSPGSLTSPDMTAITQYLIFQL
ncbi:MAG: carboxypeptidase regulatory-like domain-containing protein [Myxococcales bacterium]|nr:carboxypeptidase regulatory-like domain-containing protein [Myxococcales bacterium]